MHGVVCLSSLHIGMHYNRKANKRSGVKYGEYNYDLIDSNGNTVGKVHQGHRVNGEVVPKHAHLYNDPTNIHYWFENK